MAEKCPVCGKLYKRRLADFVKHLEKHGLVLCPCCGEIHDPNDICDPARELAELPLTFPLKYIPISKHGR